MSRAAPSARSDSDRIAIIDLKKIRALLRLRADRGLQTSLLYVHSGADPVDLNLFVAVPRVERNLDGQDVDLLAAYSDSE